MKKNLRITGIDAELLAALKARAERNKRSVEEEVLEILRTEYADQPMFGRTTEN